MKSTLIILASLLIGANAFAQKTNTVEKRTWNGTPSSETYVMKNGELIPVEQANATSQTANATTQQTTTTDNNLNNQSTANDNQSTANDNQLTANDNQLTANDNQSTDKKLDTRPGAYRQAKNFYAWAGRNFVSIVGGGYTYDFADGKHILDVSVLDWRTRCFGMSLLNFEIEMGPFCEKAIYKPTINFYIPICKALALKLYGGAECDLSYVYQADDKYDYDFDRDFFFNVDAGLGFQIVPHGCLPIEILCEYRYPIESLTKDADRLTQGFYLTGRLYLGVPVGRTK